MPNKKRNNIKKDEKLEKAKVSLAEMMESLRPFLPKREIYEPEPSKDWRMSEECPAAVIEDERKVVEEV